MLPEPKKIESFEDAMHNDPVVHAYMTQYMQGDNENYIETLRKIIVHLVNEKNIIFHRAISELESRSSPIIIKDW